MALAPIRQHFQSFTFPIKYVIRECPDKAYNELSCGEMRTVIPKETAIIRNNEKLIAELSKAENLIHEKLYLEERSYCKVDGLQDERERDMLELYAAYLCYCCLVWGEEIERHEPIVYAYISAHGASSVEDNCWAYIDDMISNDEVGQFYICRDSESADKLDIRMSCTSLQMALKTQIMLHIYSGEDGKKGASLGFCANCGQPFIKEHGGKRLCKDCGSSAGRSKAHRDRMKEAGVNAEKSNNAGK